LIKPNGYFRAENGLFSVSRRTLCSYASNRLREEPKCFRLTDAGWTEARPVTKNSRQPDYLDFAPCDPLNQLNIAIQQKDFAALLPRSAAVKQVVRPNAQKALVAYSDAPEQRVAYSLRLAVFGNRNGKWTRGADIAVGADASFCGMRVIGQSSGTLLGSISTRLPAAEITSPSGATLPLGIHNLRHAVFSPNPQRGGAVIYFTTMT
jgi:hypothetical protein